MPSKVFVIDSIGPVKVYKRKGARSIRLSIVGDGTVRVSQPRWLPYKAGIEFAQSRGAWIIENRRPDTLLYDGQQIGKSYQLNFINSESATKPTSRIVQNKIVVKSSPGQAIESPEVQAAAVRGIERALKRDSEELLLPRLKELARLHGFSYRSVSVRKLKSRWGSCSQNKDIVLSSYLIQLPWNLIDYVLLHELQHTVILAHGKKFWSALSNHVSDLKLTRKAIKEFQARII